MIDEWLFVLTLLSALGSGLMAGFFYGFSTVIMKALARLEPPWGIAAMNSINLVVINPWFLAVFLGTGLAGLALAVSSLFRWHEPGAGYRLAGGLLYVAGTFLVTMIFNVPRNNALAAVDPSSAEGARLWADYLRSWTAWNHVRTAAALAAAALFTLGLCAGR
ncbi:MAG: anthrone oxygenase family protein [Acidobacteriota bacterium]